MSNINNHFEANVYDLLEDFIEDMDIEDGEIFSEAEYGESFENRLIEYGFIIDIEACWDIDPETEIEIPMILKEVPITVCEQLKEHLQKFLEFAYKNKINIYDYSLEQYLDAVLDEPFDYRESEKGCEKGRYYFIVDSFGDETDETEDCMYNVDEFEIEDGTLIKYKGSKDNGRNVIIPAIVDTIGDHAFAGCDTIRFVNIPETVLEIGESAFENCVNLGIVLLPSYLSEIAEKTFSGCTNLRKIELPKSLITIGKFAFSNCRNLRELTIPYSVMYIEDNAFEECEMLGYVIIPHTLMYLGNNAYKNCKSLDVIICTNDIYECGENIFDGCADEHSFNVLSSSEPVNYIILIDKVNKTKIFLASLNLSFCIGKKGEKDEQ